jgi:lipopolysaccharide exporter
VLWNTNRKQHEVLLQLPLLALAGPAWWWLAPSGIRGIAMVSAGVILGRALVITAAALRALELRWTTIAGSAARGLGLAGLCAAAELAGLRATAPLASPLAAVVAGAVCAAGIMLFVLLLKPAAFGPEALTAIMRLAPPFAARLARTGVVTDSRRTVA